MAPAWKPRRARATGGPRTATRPEASERLGILQWRGCRTKRQAAGELGRVAYLPTWLPMTPPTAAPPTVPTALPPVRTAPPTAPTPAPIAVLLSRADMPLHPPKPSRTVMASALTANIFVVFIGTPLFRTSG